MKKRILWLLVVVFCSITASAYQKGDYIYTSAGKYKVIGDNLITNGDFSQVYTGWKTLGGADLSADFWSVEQGQGPDVTNALMSLSAADEQDGATMYQAIPYGAGKTYTISFKMKASEASTSTTTVGSPWYIDVYSNIDGSPSKAAAQFSQIASLQSISADGWKQYSFAYTDTVTGGSTGFIVIALGRLSTGTLISNFEVREVTQVYDTRKVEKTIAYAKKLMAINEFTVKNEELSGITDMLETTLKTGDGSALGINYDDISSWTSFMDTYQDAIRLYLDANSYDVIAGGKINKGDFSTMPEIRAGTAGYGDWKWWSPKQRWMHYPKTDYIHDYIQANYDLGTGYVYIENSTLPPGKYFFSIESKGNIMISKSSKLMYTPDYQYRIPGCKVFIGKDSVDCDTLDTQEYSPKFIIAEVAEGDTLRAGFWHPSPTVGSKMGGDICIKNPVLRFIGTNAEQVMTDYVLNKNLKIQQEVLKQYIDSANYVKPLSLYPWGKDSLQKGIDKHQKVYDWSFTTAARSECEALNVYLPDSVMYEFREMRADIRNYYSYNLPFTNLVTELNIAQTSFDDPANAKASATSKANLKTAIDNANALISGVKGDSHDADSLNMENAKEALKTAMESFEMSVASYTNPASMVIKNQYLDEFPGGWTFIGPDVNQNGGLKLVSSAYYDGGNCVSSYRGYTGWQFNRLFQVITLSQKGTYEFTCQAVAYNERKDKGYEKPCGIVFYAKNTETADSIAFRDLHTRVTLLDTIGYGGAKPERFVITYNKVDAQPINIEFGLNAAEGFNDHSCNTYTIGGFDVRYLGEYNAYLTDDKTTLSDLVSESQRLLDENVILSDKAAYKAVRNGVIAAKAALGTTNQAATFIKRTATETDAEKIAASQTKAYMMLKPLLPGLNDLITGVKGVIETTKQNIQYQNGVFNLSGLKVADSDSKNLPKGIYIIHGEKRIVK